MALTEARAAWQRTANRYLVQEDAKRAPKLAYCSSIPPAKQANTEQTSAAFGQDIPSTGSLPYTNHDPSYSNLSPNSRWWLQLRPNYGYQKVLIDEKLNSKSMESSHNKDNKSNENDFGEFCPRNFQEPLNLGVKEQVGETRDEIFLGCEVSKNVNELYFDSESSWIGAEKSTPWWRTADTEELAFLVARSSSALLENCDLPSPHSRVKQNSNVSIRNYSPGNISKSSLDLKPGTGCREHFSAQLFTPGRSTMANACPKLMIKAEGQLIAGADKQSSPINERIAEVHKFDDDGSKAELLEALRHSQTRAREAEKAAKQASQEKEHVVKLVFRQASQLFAYKQWLQLLQLENMYFQFKDNTSLQKPRKIRKRWQKSSNRKWVRRARSRYDVSKYAIVFALGLGFVGAGLILGWAVGWVLW